MRSALTDLLTEILADRPSRNVVRRDMARRRPSRSRGRRHGRRLIAAQRCGAVLLEYPVWMWHWATPGDAAVPWDRLHAMPLADNAIERKRRRRSATAASSSQPVPMAAPMLPPFVLRRLLAVSEVVFC